TCIVYQYFKELVAFVLKAGAKIRTFSDNLQTFFKVFFVFIFCGLHLIAECQSLDSVSLAKRVQK
ncbi:hypothetical protein SCY51_19255, partial [Bacteroides ovatus]|uniref:hypothetical protein n=1 Tax=Bacteroides ovatus TaxID=28116 RepID=UPI002993BA18|nr:hypothetical protein [Bacteroides ovatus]